MKPDSITTLLDVVGLALIAFGIGAALFPLIGWAAAAPAGCVVLAGVRVATWLVRPQMAPAWWRNRMRGGDR
ncbi:hypothetical protein LWC34_38895 [Kibdelosporangium philippinense]|uniref:Uncharacterized protein n=1 Tax=Kibdelosporangium philippinense TaxID=211113 RepID=A0ABS8ZLR2_9PSEU|nr:hypothetical protein [Kibdelosporangium philippinense]MCE7008738.1 hypothetical protein [Kibdelosporangium philippinense]